MRTLATLLIALFGAAALASGLACEEDDGLGVSSIRIADACEDYCGRKSECDDETDVGDCISSCEDSLDDCMADEQDDAVGDVEGCAEESCDDFTGCTIGAGLECAFGI
jgi:hypothetical protein